MESLNHDEKGSIVKEPIIASLLAAGLSALTAACSADPSGNAAGNAAAAAPGWNAADACATIDKAVVAEAAGAPVTGMQLMEGVSGGGLGTVSTCTYELGDAGSVSVLLREAAQPNYSAEAVEKARTMGGAIPPAEDVPGLGRAALWSKALSSLQVFLDDRRYATIQVVTPLSAKDPKAVATAIAGKLV